MDGYSVLIKLMERFLHSKTLDWTSSKKEFWHCASEIGLTEAIVIKLWCFPTYFNYVSRHLSTLDVVILDRLLALLDPTAACVRPLARLFQNADESYDNVRIFYFTLKT